MVTIQAVLAGFSILHGIAVPDLGMKSVESKSEQFLHLVSDQGIVTKEI